MSSRGSKSAIKGEQENLDRPAPATPNNLPDNPNHSKLTGWKSDGGKCVNCGAKEDLHIDHIIPSSKGGPSIMAENVQLLYG